MTQYTYGLTRLVGHGHAFTERVVVKNPSAGAGFTYNINAGYWELIDLIGFQLVTNGNAGSRQVLLTIKDADGTIIGTFPSASTQAATNTYHYTWSRDFNSFNTVISSAVTGPLPGILLQPDMSVVVTVGSIDAGDQISGIRIISERFVTGESGYLLGVLDSTVTPAELLTGFKAETA